MITVISLANLFSSLTSGKQGSFREAYMIDEKYLVKENLDSQFISILLILNYLFKILEIIKLYYNLLF